MEGKPLSRLLAVFLIYAIRLRGDAYDERRRRRRSASMSDSEIMTVLLLFHFGSFRNFKHYYFTYIKGVLRSDFPTAVSYNRFVELEGRVFFQLIQK